MCSRWIEAMIKRKTFVTVNLESNFMFVDDKTGQQCQIKWNKDGNEWMYGMNDENQTKEFSHAILSPFATIVMKTTKNIQLYLN